MIFVVLADIVVLVHSLWTLFLVLGALLGVRRRWAKVVHLLGLAYAGVTVPFDIPCPFSTLGVWLRTKQGAHSDYTGHFIAYYAEKILHIQLPFPFIEVATILLCLFNLWLYFGKSAAPLRHRLSGSH